MERLVTSLRQARAAAGFSQAQLAQAVGISRQAYAAIEHADATPSTDVSLRLARTLATTVESLFSLGDDTQAHRATLTERVGAEAALRADVHRVGGRWVARPLAGSSSHPAVTRSLPVANAIVRPLPGTDEADVELLERPAERSLVVVGCDPSMSVVAAHLQARGVSLSLYEMGSAAALRELADGNAHVAGCHLLDAATGQYNVPLVRRYLPFPATVVTFAVWDQGFVVAAGNPKHIRGVLDLARPGIVLVNREPGSGSRALLESTVAAEGLAATAIAGFGHEARSHLSVAEVVGMGLADTGVAVRAAAIAFGLDFVPIGQERYDLVIPDHFLSEPGVVELLAALRRTGLRRQIEALGGYDVASMGTEPTAA